uniref:DUF218 domain-containing protein n=1 Tax=viral metagenome TaxID=1070528 RepID=A0A6C0E665_9ZZZZ
MYIIILGGSNDENNNLSVSTISRLNCFNDTYKLYKHIKPKIIISGGYRFSKKAHCKIIKEYILTIQPECLIEKEFIENNDTIDEALSICSYLSSINYNGCIKIITSSWHMGRAKYLFNITSNHLKNMEIEYIDAYEINEVYLEEEKNKLNQLIENPYGKWLDYINSK